MRKRDYGKNSKSSLPGENITKMRAAESHSRMIADVEINNIFNKTLSEVVRDYYRSHNNSFVNLDYESIMAKVKEILVQKLRPHLELKEITLQKFNRVLSIVRPNNIIYFMKKIDLKAFDDFKAALDDQKANEEIDKNEPDDR